MEDQEVRFCLLIEGVQNPFYFHVPASEIEETIKDLTEEDFFQFHTGDRTGFRVETCYIKLFYWEPKMESIYKEAVKKAGFPGIPFNAATGDGL